MWRLVTVLLAFSGVSVIPAAPITADDPVLSGPQPGEKLPPLNLIVGSRTSGVRELDIVGEAEGRPLLLVFLHERTRPAGALNRVLMNYGEIRMADGLLPVSIRLTDDPSTASQRLGAQAPEEAVSGVSPDGLEGPGSYGLNRNVGVTVLVGKDGRVTGSFALVQPSVTDATDVIAAVVQLIGGDVPTTPELQFLAMNPDAAERFRVKGVAPQDPKLREKICCVLRAQAEPDTLEAAVDAAKDYVGDDAGRQLALGEASRALLNQRYQGADSVVSDSPVGQQFKEWAQEFGKRNSNAE